MRYLMLLVVLLSVSAPPAFSAADVNFDTFIKSREVVATLYFDSNTDVLSKEEQARLARAVEQIRAVQKMGRLIRVEGFSSPEGNQEENFKLSFFRARSVADMIESTGVPAEITLTGYGDLKARSVDLSKERRVEIASYLKPAGMKRIKVAFRTLFKTPFVTLIAIVSLALGIGANSATFSNFTNFRGNSQSSGRSANREKSSRLTCRRSYFKGRISCASWRGLHAAMCT